jgi:hypothetical protein
MGHGLCSEEGVCGCMLRNCGTSLTNSAISRPRALAPVSLPALGAVVLKAEGRRLDPAADYRTRAAQTLPGYPAGRFASGPTALSRPECVNEHALACSNAHLGTLANEPECVFGHPTRLGTGCMRLRSRRERNHLPLGLCWISVPAVANPGPQSILLVEVPEAEPIVGRYRERFVVNARLGVPAHITVLYPFMPPRAIGPAVTTELEHLFAAVSRFRFQLTHLGWFGDEVLWLGPWNPAPFRALTRRVDAAFPDVPPYEGQFGRAESDASPHLTVGKGNLVTELRSAEENVRSHLPIDGEATSVTLMTQVSAGGRWAKTAIFALA